MKLNLIFAHDKNFMIGLNNRLPWESIPEDLQRFKAITTGSAVIMGRNTWLSIGENQLKDRPNIVVSSNPNWYAGHDCSLGVYDAFNLGDAMPLLDDTDEAFVIGGKNLFEEAFPLADKLYITTIDQETEDNGTGVYFKYSLDGFTKIAESPRDGYCFHVYERTNA